MNSNNYKGFYNIVSNTAKTEATIYIYGVIGGYDYEEWKPINTANTFTKDFNALKADIVRVRINSPGGNVWDGLPIYNTLKNSKKTIYTYVDGIAFSMAALIALSGDKVYGYANSMLMYHNGSCYAFGNADEMRKEADTLDQYDKALGSIIEEKLSISAEEVKEKYLNYTDNYFVGNEAKTLGFFDEIITGENNDVNVPDNIKKMSPTDLIKHYAKLNFKEETPKTRKSISNQNTMSNLKTPLIEAVIGANFSDAKNETGILLTDDQATAIENKLSANDAEVSKFKNEATTAKDEVIAATAKITTLTSDNTSVTNAVQNALKTAGVENAATMTNEAGVIALSNLVAKYGANDGGKGTTPLPSSNNNENPNVIAGVDITGYLNS
ncbi:head maturation protease, ClpP-related [Tenacibaculum finnmarkense]|uniref:head maturation protease, ClpP-related n=1 Tax=Tenacibaculum finnmarkense TaxID=2781243 RepID=UPI001EFBC477|nr:head maturation protease, ClpP-related [Tenacibaculum finnmarkense]MCG8734003.1 Clp protease ClpP [Tenacibaculum finnmarkense]